MTDEPPKPEPPIKIDQPELAKADALDFIFGPMFLNFIDQGKP